MSKILITGGAGFIGSRLAYNLIKEGHQIVIVDNMSYGHLDNFEFEDMNILEKCSFFKINAEDDIQMKYLFEFNKFDYVYHIAGIAPLPDCQLNKKECLISNVVSTEVILEYSRIYGVKRVMFASSNSVYEMLDKRSFPFKEDQVIETRLFYPTSKHLSEEICKSFNRTYNLPITIFRFSNVYGPAMDIMRKYPPVTGAFIKNLYYNKQSTIYSNGEQSRDFIFIDDLIDLIKLPMTNAKKDFEIMNVTSGETYSINEQYNILQNIMNKNITPIYVKEDDFWKKIPEIYEGYYKISTETLKKEVNKCTHSSYNYAKIEYGWTPKYSFEEGLKLTVEGMIKILRRKDK